MLKILTVIGARPQIIKAAAISRAIRNKFSDKIGEFILHTGQHYDDNMSKVFFEEMHIPRPDHNLNVGSGSHGKQTSVMLEGIEEVIFKEKPDCLVVYGDTNSTLAAAIAASKTHIPVIHIEAGLRSFNKSMPEEVNRIVCDHVSTLLFTPTKTGYQNLIREGLKEGNDPPYSADNPRIYHCGDVMYDNSMYFSEIARGKSSVLKDNDLEQDDFILVTIHRDNNTDDTVRFNALFSSIQKISGLYNIKMAVPLHPRAGKLLKQNLSPQLYEAITGNDMIRIMPAVSFLEMINLEISSKLIMTDSGGVQKEAFFFKKPCIILRPQTEWVELVKNGNNIVADADEGRILEAYEHLCEKSGYSYPPLFGDGHAAEFICEEILKYIPVKTGD